MLEQQIGSPLRRKRMLRQLEWSYSCRRRAVLTARRPSLEDPWGTGQRRQGWLDSRQSLVSSDCKIAVRREPTYDAGEHLLLKRRREIGERDIAAEDEIEQRSGAFLSQILMQELNAPKDEDEGEAR